jgi:probable HAF family extracellular repeat protein
LLGLCVLLALLPSRLWATVPLYGMVDLGTLGGTWSVALGINASGEIVGGSLTASGNVHAFSYSGEKMTDLGVFSGGANSTANAVNDSGQITGWSTTDGVDTLGNPIVLGFLYSGGKTSSIGALVGDVDSEGLSINSTGNICGISYTPDATTGTVADENAVIYSPARGMSNLGPLSGGFFSEANGINDSGQIAGVSDTGQSDSSGNDIYRAIRYASGGGIFSIPLLLDQVDSVAYGINDSGNVIGYDYTSTGASYAFTYSNLGGLIALGLLPGGSNSFATAVNSSGQIVGYGDIGASDASGNTIYHAFLYTGGKLYDMNTLTANAKGWRIDDALAINDSGEIVGQALNPAGQAHAILLTPLSDAAPIIVTQPAAAAVKAGGKVTLMVSALSGSLISYHWQKSGVPIANATLPSLTLSKVTSANTGTYDVVLKNSIGTTTSNSVLLQVVTKAPTMTTQPVALTLKTGATATFSAVVAGDPPLTLNWQKNGANLTNANNYKIATTTTTTTNGTTTSTTLTITKITAGNVASYRVAASNLAGKATSASVKLTISK